MPDKNGWISVNESYPNDERPCLLVVFEQDNSHISVGNYYGDGYWTVVDYAVELPHVTHWMDLPELPND